MYSNPNQTHEITQDFSYSKPADQNHDLRKEDVKQLIDQVNLKTQTIRQEKKAKTDLAPYGKILFTYADRNDKIMIYTGYFFSILTGIGLPTFVFLFGDIVNSFTGNNVLDAIKPTCL